MSLPRGDVSGLLAKWSIAPNILSVTFDDKSFVLSSGAVRLVEAKDDRLVFALRPKIESEPLAEFFLVRLDGSEVWDDTTDPLGLDCVFERGAFLTIRAAPDLRDLDLEPTSTGIH